VALAGVVVVSAGCSGGVRAHDGASAAPCSVKSGPGFRWPVTVPRDLPLPGGATLTSMRTLPSGFTEVRFISPRSVHDSVLFAIARLQSAGYTVGRGMGGPGETNLPFTKGGQPGAIRLIAVNPCTTSWQVLA
jgi:hypothetical protein